MRGVWRAVARDLFEDAIAKARLFELDGVGAWATGQVDGVASARVRWVSDPSALALDAFSGLQERARWDDVPTARGIRAMRASFDQGGGIFDAVSESGDDWPPRVAGGVDGGVRWLVRCDDDEPHLALRTESDDGAVELRVQWSIDDRHFTVREIFCAVERREDSVIRRAHAWGFPAQEGVVASVVGGADELKLDRSGRPEGWRADRRERRDLAGGAPGETVDSTDDQQLLGHVLGCVEHWIDARTPVPVWSTRLHGTPPKLDDSDDAVATAARAMLQTIIRATADLTLPAPCALSMDPNLGDRDRPLPLPELVVVDRAFRDRYAGRRRKTPATSELHLAPEAGQGVQLSLIPFADDATLDGWLPLQRLDYRSRGVSVEQQERTGRYQDRLRHELSRLVLEHPWPAPWDRPVLPWLRLYETSGLWADLWKELRTDAPRRVWNELHDAWTAAPTKRGATTKAGPPPLPRTARRSREALRRLLARHGLREHGDALSEAARPGFRLTRARAADAGVSRIAGPPLLPEGTAWPTTGDGKPLTFLAAIDLAELPAHDDELPVPGEGLMLFYVLTGDRAEWDGTPPWADDPGSDPVAVLVVPPGTPVNQVPPPPSAALMARDPEAEDFDAQGDTAARPFPLRFSPVVQPAADHQVAERLGLHPAEASVYESIAQAGFESPDDERTIGGVFLGASTGPQGHPIDDDHVMLLALNGTPRLGTDWGSEGDLRILISREDLQRQRWDRAFSQGDG